VPGPIEIIVNEVAAEFGITAKALLSRNRSNRVSHPRILAMALARKLTKASFPAIGRAFGRDHSSVMSAVARSPELQKRYPDYAVKYEIVKHRLLSPPQP
jgi:chromosomal replication initiator protein